jgi:hypothetical protein
MSESSTDLTAFRAGPQRVHPEDGGGPWLTGGDWFADALGTGDEMVSECVLLVLLDLSVARRITSSSQPDALVLHGTKDDMQAVADTLNRLAVAVALSGLSYRQLILAAREIPGNRLLDYLCAGLSLEQARAYEADGTYDRDRLATLAAGD